MRKAGGDAIRAASGTGIAIPAHGWIRRFRSMNSRCPKCGSHGPGVSAFLAGKSSLQVHGCHTSRSEEHTSELQSLMRSSYAVFCLKNNKKTKRKYYT